MGRPARQRADPRSFLATPARLAAIGAARVARSPRPVPAGRAVLQPRSLLGGRIAGQAHPTIWSRLRDIVRPFEPASPSRQPASSHADRRPPPAEPPVARSNRAITTAIQSSRRKDGARALVRRNLAGLTVVATLSLIWLVGIAAAISPGHPGGSVLAATGPPETSVPVLADPASVVPRASAGPAAPPSARPSRPLP